MDTIATNPIAFQGPQDPRETLAMKGWRGSLAGPAHPACEVRTYGAAPGLLLLWDTDA